jgi:uncharacterized protein YbbK (DUF523 family)
VRITNHTGIGSDTKVYDDDGEDITKTLRITAVRVMTIRAGEPVRAILVCERVELDIVAPDAEA